MHSCLRCSNSTGGVVHEHLLQQVDAVSVQLGDHLAQVLGLPLGKLVPVPQPRNPGPHILAGRSEELEDVEELLELGVAREERLLARELGEDATHGPDVHRRGVVRAAEENLGLYPQAIEHADRALALMIAGDSPNVWSLQLTRAQILWQLDRKSEARSVLTALRERAAAGELDPILAERVEDWAATLR